MIKTYTGLNYFNPKNKKGFFADWYRHDEYKLDYIYLGIMTFFFFLTMIWLWFE